MVLEANLDEAPSCMGEEEGGQEGAEKNSRLRLPTQPYSTWHRRRNENHKRDEKTERDSTTRVGGRAGDVA